MLGVKIKQRYGTYFDFFLIERRKKGGPSIAQKKSKRKVGNAKVCIG